MESKDQPDRALARAEFAADQIDAFLAKFKTRIHAALMARIQEITGYMPLKEECMEKGGTASITTPETNCLKVYTWNGDQILRVLKTETGIEVQPMYPAPVILNPAGGPIILPEVPDFKPHGEGPDLDEIIGGICDDIERLGEKRRKD